jgi:type II secretory pathway component PulK
MSVPCETKQRVADNKTRCALCGPGCPTVAPRREKGRGTVLIVTMWIVLVLAGLVLVFARTIRVEAIASANQVATLQAESVARGALQFVLSQVDAAQESSLFEDETAYEQVQIGEGYFWILRPNLDDDRTYYFGITDEASRLNLNTATLDMLLKLPGMTAELAPAIIDWRDEDNEVSPGGAESEYYLLLAAPYYCKDAPFETVDEVLLVKEASHEVLYGEDVNRNGVLDSNENDASESQPPDDRDGNLDRGLFDYSTVYSVEPNESSSGEERVNVNSPNTQALSALLRQAVPQDKFFYVMEGVGAGRPFLNILDFYYRTGLTISEFAAIADQLTTSGEDDLVGLVNVNTAPRQVLLCLPELDEGDVDALLQKRIDPGTDLSSIAWVADALPQEKAIAVGGHITIRSFQYSADIVSVSGSGRAYKRYRAVVDARYSPPRVVYWKDLTHLGWPLSTEIISTLRAGTPLSDTVLTVGNGGG